MKKLLLLIVLAIGLSVFSNAENINECKTDIYYGNGVWNEYEDADDSRWDLESLIEDEIINRNPLLEVKYGKVKLVYNWGQGYVLDVLEVYYQLREAGQLDGIGFYLAIARLTVGNPEIMLGAMTTQALMEPFTRDWEAGNVDEMWQKYYNESFKLGHRVLLVSHSQGNLFANRIYDMIDPTGYKIYFANLQVASPANEVKAPKGDHVTLYGDPIINPIPESMAGNANGNPGHAFVGAYLDQEDPYTKIVTKMKQFLETLDSESSQWETDQEYDKDTCDYRITVKHRFDDEIIMDEEVYPFAPSKKLYQVNGEWVKASCGGENILDEWEGKQTNECLMIDNPKIEKIVGDLCNSSFVYDPSEFEIISYHAMGTRYAYVRVKILETNEIKYATPFNLEGSLYLVKGDLLNDGHYQNRWVIASCGGSEIFSVWEGKENHEQWMINNPEKEKILARYQRDHEKEVVIDTLGSIMWQDNIDSVTIRKQWITDGNFNLRKLFDTSGDTAATYCENLTLAGYDDWVLPSGGQLYTLNSELYRNGDLIVFENILPSSNYWSSSSYKYNYYHGEAYHYPYTRYYDFDKRTQLNIRCIRYMTDK
jgi:hypothetical protein